MGAIVAGSAIGLAIVAVAVETAGLAAGWPSSFPSVSSMLFPQLGGLATPLALVVFAGTFLVDAITRRAVFRRVAHAEISLTAAMVSIPLLPGLWLMTGITHTLPWPVGVAAGAAFMRWRSQSTAAPPLRLSTRARVVGATTLAAGALAGAALVTAGPHLASANVMVPSVVGAHSSGGDGLDVRRAQPLNWLVGRRPSRVIYYTFGITTVGPLPAAVDRATAHASGPGLRVLRTAVLSGSGAAHVHHPSLRRCGHRPRHPARAPLPAARLGVDVGRPPPRRAHHHARRRAQHEPARDRRSAAPDLPGAGEGRPDAAWRPGPRPIGRSRGQLAGTRANWRLDEMPIAICHPKIPRDTDGGAAVHGPWGPLRGAAGRGMAR